MSILSVTIQTNRTAVIRAIVCRHAIINPPNRFRAHKSSVDTGEKRDVVNHTFLFSFFFLLYRVTFAAVRLVSRRSTPICHRKERQSAPAIDRPLRYV